MPGSLRHPLNVLSLSGSGKLLAVAYSNRVQIVDVQSGKLLATSALEDSHGQKTLIRHLVWHQDDKLVSSGEDKIVKEWGIESSPEQPEQVKLVLVDQRELPKRPNAISITSDGNNLVIADKFGDVYAFPMHGCPSDLPLPPTASFPSDPSSSSAAQAEVKQETATPPPQSQKETGTRKGTAKNPEWRHVPARVSALRPVLGHVSMLTSLLLLDDKQNSEQGNSRIITADRDEHVRISKWPHGWEVERFLLGHKKFVAALALLPTDPSILLTAGGDDDVRAWSLENYTCISKNAISLEHLKGTASIVVELEQKPSRRQKRRQAQGKQQGSKKAKLSETTADAAASPAGDTEDSTVKHEDEGDANVEGQLEESVNWKPNIKVKKLDIAIRKMVFVGCGAAGAPSDRGVLVLLSVSSSSLLVYPVATLLDSSIDPSSRPYQLISFSRPVLEIVGAPNGQDLWVSVDMSAEVKSDSTPSVAAEQSINHFTLNAEGKLEVAEHASVATLNEVCSEAVSEESPFPNVKALYPDVALLSKDPSDRPDGNAGEDAEEEGGPDDSVNVKEEEEEENVKEEEDNVKEEEDNIKEEEE